MITKKGKIVSKGKTPLIGLASERQQSPLLRVKEQKMMAEQGRGWKKNCLCQSSRKDAGLQASKQDIPLCGFDCNTDPVDPRQ